MKTVVSAMLSASTAIGLAAIAHPAFAADAAATAEAAATEAAASDDIIVTANKRDESISKVGSSVVAFDNTTLEKRNIVRLDELARAVPNLTLAPSTHGTPVFTLRGVGFNADSLGVYPAVSLSLDQAPSPSRPRPTPSASP